MDHHKDYARLIAQYDQLKSYGVNLLLDQHDEENSFLNSLLAKLIDLRNSEGVDHYIAHYAIVGLIACLESFAETNVFNKEDDV